MKNLKFSTAIALLMFITFVSFGFKGCKESDRNYKQKHETKQFYDSLPVEMRPMENYTVYKTPKNVHVAAEDPIAAEKQAEQFKAVDDGIDRLLLATAAFDWKFYTKHSDYVVMMIRPTHKSEIDGAGLLMTRGGISTCGTIVSPPWNRIDIPFIVISQNPDHPEMVRNCTKNEGEHKRAAMNDMNVFQKFVCAGCDIHANFPLADDNEWYSSKVTPPVIVPAIQQGVRLKDYLDNYTKYYLKDYWKRLTE